MTRFHLAALAALMSTALGQAHAADPVLIHLTGNTRDFMAVTEVKGYNCSQYNPCNPSTPAYFSTDSFGNLSNGQAFSADITLDLAANQITASTWTSADGKAAFEWPNGSIYSSYQRSTFSIGSGNNDVLTLFSETQPKSDVSPSYLSSTYFLTFLPGTLKGGAITGAELIAAANTGKLVSAVGASNFDYWGSACGGHMAFSIAGASISSVPEPQSWATLMLGLGLLAAHRRGSSQRGRQTSRA